ncbi:hypothetical protein IFM89_030464 [Coptis chinensis]|uniref:ABC transporter domain-containing protein n=1 Tax=Coptis chinensis TaxID=261450 RepID=A0A835H6B1_9MAGN|nr:hypothetical protein IFM89_030464 [Coptis chinensis]
MKWNIENNPAFVDTTPAVSFSSDRYSTISDGFVAVPFNEKVQGVSSCSSPEVRYKIENSSPETTKYLALRMYGSLKKHGLRNEVVMALGGDDVEAEELKEVELGGSKKVEELMGMEYLLKDGLVSYLRDVVRITPPIPQQVVRFSDIKYTRTFKSYDGGYATFGNKLVGCFSGPFKRFFERKNLTQLQILKGVDGYIMPGSMTLLLGPPGSGKSTLLEILAGRVQEMKGSVLEGVVKYNNQHASDIRLSRLIAYVGSQLNKHVPFLSVRETLEFARDCTQRLQLENFTPQMRKFFAHALVEGQDPFLEYVLEILGLKEIEHRLVGEEISDVDRQKLTTAELALGTYSVMIYDQPLSGSDPTSTYDLVDTIRTISRIQQSSAIMSLAQLSQEAFDLFDRIIILSDGRILFQGPRQDVIPYFNTLGYSKPSHAECGEFLEDIAAGDGAQYLTSAASQLSLDELVECYRVSENYKDVMRIVEGEDLKHTYWVDCEPGLCLSLKTPSKYSISINFEPSKETELVVAKLSTKVGHSGGIESTGRVQAGDVVTGISMNNERLQYLAVGTKKIQRERASNVYSLLKRAQGQTRLQVERYEDEEDDYKKQWKHFQGPFVQTWWKSTKTLIKRQIKITNRLHALTKLRLFQAMFLGVFAGTLFYKLGGKYSQQEMNSVRALGFALAYTLCVYFLAGLSMVGNGALFFHYLTLLFFVAYFGSSIFFFLSAISPIPETANAFAGLIVSILLLFSGFVIYPSNIPPYWKWLMYVTPIHWANVSFCNLQFSKGYTNPCTNYLGQLPFCDQYPTMTVGEAYLVFNQLSIDSKLTWLPHVVILGWTVIANLLALLGLKKIEFTGTSPSLPQEKKTTVLSNYKKLNGSIFHSCNSYRKQSVGSSVSKHTMEQGSLSNDAQMEDGSDVNNWSEEFRVNLEKSELAIPVKPVALWFLDLSFKSAETKQGGIAFYSITGYAKPGTMLALLGGSKVSRNTLLKCLSGRTPIDGKLTGKLHVNGFKPCTTYSRLIGYVETVDAHPPYLSVRESLQFSAGLRLDRSVDSMNRHIHVELVLDQLGLMLYANHLVGSLHDATGETFKIAKKITIAVELAANPSVLFLEDPISSLDSSGTLSILKDLTQVSEFGRIIIATLTHPSATALSFFNQALVLTKEGHQGYFGPTGYQCNELLDYFTSIPTVPQYINVESPITFVMGSLGLGIKKRGNPLVDFGEIYQQSSLCATNKKEIISIKKSTKHTKPNTVLDSSYPMPYLQQAWLVMLRTQLFLWRNVQYTYGRLIGCLMIGLLMGSLYYQIESRDTYGVTSCTLYIYMQVILIGVISANNVIPQIGSDRLVYFRERRARMYLPIFYPVSWAVGEIPYFFIATLAMVGLGNGMAGIGTRSTKEFLEYWLALFIFTLCTTYFGMMLTFLAPLPTLAAFAVSIVTSMWVSASGVVVVLSDIKFYKWMYWSNPFQYVTNSLTSISFYCDIKNCEPECRCPKLPDGSYVWERLAKIRSLSIERLDTDLITLAGMCVLFSSLAFLFFVMLKHNAPPHTRVRTGPK